MNTNELVAALDTEIVRLIKIRNLLSDGNDASSIGASKRGPARSGDSSEPKRRGRPKGSKNKATSFNPEEFTTKRRTMSAAGKERIAAAQRARWAKQKETAAVKKSRPVTAKAAAAKSPGLKVATKKMILPSKKLAAKPVTKSAQPKPVPAKKIVAKAKPAKKSAVRSPTKKSVALKSLRAQSQAKPSSTPSNASVEQAVAASAE